jgi:hypothetical protein
MALATATFWGENVNSHGIPQILHTYLITVYVNQVIGMGDKIVKIVPLTDSTPKPEREHPFIVKNSDVKKAVIEAINVLKNMEELKGLKNHGSIVELDRQNNFAMAVR